MALYIYMGGLADNPEATTQLLKEKLEITGHTFVSVKVDGIITHDNRIARVINMFNHQYLKQGHKQIILVGQSAGGSAVREAAKRLEGHCALKGVVMLSPAMPRGIFFLTWTLFKRMARRIDDLLLGCSMDLTVEEHTALISPMESKALKAAVEARVQVPGNEARELAFLPPTFKPYSAPTLIIYGTEDQWINPKAQEKLINLMRKSGMYVERFIVYGAGHITLGSPKQNQVIETILSWSKEALTKQY